MNRPVRPRAVPHGALGGGRAGRAVKSTCASDVALGQAVRMWRRARRISQHSLARTCGVTFQQIRKYEAASDRISISRLARIAQALGCRCSDLVDFLGLHETAAAARPEVEAVTLAQMSPDRLELLLHYAELDAQQRDKLALFLGDHAGVAAKR
jgi:transcriptional regulator with XRE-family HTH domain